MIKDKTTASNLPLVILVTLVWIITVNVLAYAVAATTSDISQIEKTKLLEPELFERSVQKSGGWISTHLRWDSFWYLHTAKSGYFVNYEEELSNVAFMPLYPALINFFGLLLNDYVLAGWLISNICLVISVLLLYQYTRQLHPAINPWLPVLFLLIFPTAFFLTTIYTESLFLLLSLGVFYLARRHNFMLAAMVGILAALTKPQGMILIVPLLAEYFSCHGRAGLKKPTWVLFFLLPAAFICYLGFLKLKFHDPLIIFKVQSWFDRQPQRLSDLNDLTSLFFGLILVVFMLVLIYYSWQRLRISYTLYLLALLAMPLSTLSFLSLSRFYLVALPIYFVLANIKSRPLFYSWTILSLALLWNDLVFFIQGKWAG